MILILPWVFVLITGLLLYLLEVSAPPQNDDMPDENAIMRFPSAVTGNRGTIGYVGKDVPDISKVDKSVTKQLLQLYIHNDYYEDGHVWMSLLETLPDFFLWQAMISTVGSHAAFLQWVTDNNTFLDAATVAEYINLDQYSPTDNLPHCFQFLYNMSVFEKEDFFKSMWRTRSQHIDLVRILGVMNFIVVMGMAPMYAIYYTKFHIHTRLVDNVSYKAIRYNIYDRRTWEAYIYDSWAHTTLNLNEDQISLMWENIILQFNSFELIIPVEAVKLGKLLAGRFKITQFKVNGDPDYTVPVDFLFTTVMLDGSTARPFTLMGTDWVADLALFNKVKQIIQNIGTVAQTVEYGDSYYGAVFPSWKDQLKYVNFDFDLLKDWTEMLPWPLQYIGSHHHPADPIAYPSAMFWAWNAANHGNGMTPDLGTNVAPDNQAYHMFMRVVPPQLAQGDPSLQFFGLKIPGISDEVYDISLVWAWFWLTPQMGLHLQTQSERSTLADYHNISSYIEYYDTNGTLMFEQLVDVSMNLGDDDVWFGWLGTTEHPHFREFYIPKTQLSVAYPNIVKDKTYLGIADDDTVLLAPNGDTFFEKVMRNVGFYNYSVLKWGWKYTKSIMDKFLNPIFVKPVKNNPLDNAEEKKTISESKTPSPASGMPGSGVMAPPKKDIETVDVEGGKPSESYAKDEGKNGPVNPVKGKEISEINTSESASSPNKEEEKDK